MCAGPLGQAALRAQRLWPPECSARAALRGCKEGGKCGGRRCGGERLRCVAYALQLHSPSFSQHAIRVVRRRNIGLTRGGMRAAGPGIGRQGPRLCQESERAHRPGGGCAPRAMCSATCQLFFVLLGRADTLYALLNVQVSGPCVCGQLNVHFYSHAPNPLFDSCACKPQTRSMRAMHAALPKLLRVMTRWSTALMRCLSMSP